MQHSNPTWPEALECVGAKCKASSDMWPFVHFRIVADSSVKSGAESILLAHFEAATGTRQATAKLLTKNPKVLEGTVPVAEFIALIQAWRDDNPATLAQWQLEPPRGFQNTHMWMGEDMPDEPSQYPLLDPPPPHQSAYLVDRIAGSGEQFDTTLYNQLMAIMTETSENHWQWLLDYAGVRLSNLQSRYLLIQLPIAVGVDASFKPETSTVEVTVLYRSPLTTESFGVRIGSGRWDTSLSPLVAQGGSTDGDGWHVALFSAHQDGAGLRKVWVSRTDSQRDFDWEVSVDLGQPQTADQRRLDFVRFWYDLAGGKRTLGSGVKDRPPNQQAGGESADSLELAVANALAGLGWPSVFGGTALKTPGVDLVAFDSSTKRAYAISATIANDIGSKLREWLRVRASVQDVLTPLWQVQPVIVTTSSLDACLASDLEDARGELVLVIGADSLECLSESPPDLLQFKAALETKVTKPPPHTHPIFGR